MTSRMLYITRDVFLEECPWLARGLSKGMIVFEYRDHTYGCVGPNGIAVTFVDGERPFFEVPRDAVSDRLPIAEATEFKTKPDADWMKNLRKMRGMPAVPKDMAARVAEVVARYRPKVRTITRFDALRERMIAKAIREGESRGYKRAVRDFGPRLVTFEEVHSEFFGIEAGAPGRKTTMSVSDAVDKAAAISASMGA